jgi:hypothetical protein
MQLGLAAPLAQTQAAAAALAETPLSRLGQPRLRQVAEGEGMAQQTHPLAKGEVAALHRMAI